MHSGRTPRPHALTSYALDDADLLRFGCFELRPRERRLLVDGKEATVGARAFDVLLALIEHRDRLSLRCPSSSTQADTLAAGCFAAMKRPAAS
jgi:DNA-binding response OmpR family regulator